MFTKYPVFKPNAVSRSTVVLFTYINIDKECNVSTAILQSSSEHAQSTRNHVNTLNMRFKVQ